jgi:hypothetical protein
VSPVRYELNFYVLFRKNSYHAYQKNGRETPGDTHTKSACISAFATSLTNSHFYPALPLKCLPQSPFLKGLSSHARPSRRRQEVGEEE